MTNRRMKKEESREKILKAAAALFRKNGFAFTGIDELMEKAGLTAGAFYAHFKSKDHLLEEALRYALDQTFTMLTRNLEDLSPSERTKVLMSLYLSDAHRDLPHKGCALVGLAAELARQNEKIRKIVAAYIERWADFIADGLEDVPPERRRIAALSLVSGAVGGLLLSRMTKGSQISEELLRYGS